MNKVRTGEDGTLARNNIKYWLGLIEDYELIKRGVHAKFKFVNEFYNHNHIKRQNFIKYYNRFKNNNCNQKLLLPQKRGPKYKIKRIPSFIENKIIELRNNGLSRYDIFAVMKPKYHKFTPSASTIYNITKKHNLNRLVPKMMQSKKKIIKERAGDLAHIDCHYLPKGLIDNDHKRYFLVAIIDDATRIAWGEVIGDIKSLNVMFATLKILNTLNVQYNIKFNELLSDNGSEFGGGRLTKNKDSNPFEVLLKEMGIKHLYTRPYRPQTNGKIERFWKTLNEDLVEDVVFDSLEHFRSELQQYLLYYNEARPHQGIGGKTPSEFNKICHRNC